VQPHRSEQVRQALAASGFDTVTVAEAMGCGRQGGHAEVYRGQEYRIEFRPKTKLELVVHDRDLESAVVAIVSGARTGHLGDGKIFITRVAAAVRIRTGEIDEAAI